MPNNSLETRLGNYPKLLEFSKKCFLESLENHCYLTKQGKVGVKRNGILIPYVTPDLSKDQPIKIYFSNKDNKNNQDFEHFLSSVNEYPHHYYTYYTRFRKDIVQENENKYSQMPYSGSKIYFNGLRAYLQKESKNYADLEYLLITEGEIKSIVTNYFDIPSVGIGGITNFTKDGIHELLALTPNLNTLILNFDNDLFNYSSEYKYSPDSEKITQIDSRQKSFFDAYKRLNKIISQINISRKENNLPNVKLKSSYHHLDSEFKGIDDFLLGNEDKISEIKICFELQKNGRLLIFEDSFQNFKSKFDTLKNFSSYGAYGIVTRVWDRFVPQNKLEQTYLKTGRNGVIGAPGTGKSNFWKTPANFAKALKIFDKIIIIVPIKRLEKGYAKDIPNNIHYVIVDSDNPMTENYKKEISEAQVIITTPYSYYKVDSLLNLNARNLARCKVVCDEFDYLDFDIFDKRTDNYDSKVISYLGLLQNAPNITFISASPNFAMLRHLGLQKEDINIFDFPNRKTDTTFHFVYSDKNTSKKKKFVANTLQLIGKNPTKKHLIYVNDKQEAKELGNMLVKNSNGTFTTSDFALCDADSIHAQTIIDTERLPTLVNFVTSWALYGINIRDNAFLSIYETNFKLTYAQLLQFVGRTRDDYNRICFLYLNDMKISKDIAVLNFFATQNTIARAKCLNENYGFLGDDTANFRNYLYFDNNDVEYKTNHIEIAVKTLHYELWLTKDVLQNRLQTFAQVHSISVDASEVNIPKDSLPDKLSTLCEEMQIDDIDNLDAFFDNIFTDDTIAQSTKKAIPKYKNTIHKCVNHAPKEKKRILESVKNGHLDSNKGINKFFKLLKAIRLLNTTESKSTIRIESQPNPTEFQALKTDFIVRQKFLSILTPIFHQIQNSQKGYIDFTKKDILDLETEALIKKFGSEPSETSIFFEFASLLFDVKPITARDKNGDIRKFWRFSICNFYEFENSITISNFIKVTKSEDENSLAHISLEDLNDEEAIFWNTQPLDECPF